MPCHAKETAPHFSALTPIKHGFSLQEVLGHSDKENPASFGVFAVNPGHPISYDNTPYHLFATVTEGELTLEDRDNAETLHLKAGDIFHVVRGTSFKWNTPSTCKGTYVMLKPLGDHEYLSGLY